jgi:DNA-binding response OmpR family regulator
MKILIVEDEQELAQDIVSYLSALGILCERAANYHEASVKINAYSYDCILLDLMLPDGNGLDLLSMIKQSHGQAGVIIISAKNALEDKISGLQIGADDYLAKPFHQSELAARIHAVIRRKQFDNSNVLIQNELSIDLLARTVSIRGEEVILTKKEFDLLLFFVGNKNRVLSKGALAEHLSGDFADMFDTHDFVYAHVKNLKKKLNQHGYGGYLNTIYGTGYQWRI